MGNRALGWVRCGEVEEDIYDLLCWLVGFSLLAFIFSTFLEVQLMFALKKPVMP